MEAIIPYLIFNGNAAEALAFYTRVLDGKVVFQQSFGESPVKVSASEKDRVMHATFQAGKLSFMASDSMPGQPVSGGSNLSLSINCKTVDEIEKVFAAMSEEATVTMELQDTFWGARFGMLTDKFGINWMFNHDYEKKEN